MGFATAVSPGRGNLVAEVEKAPRAIVEGHCPGEPRGRSAVNRTQSRRGRKRGGVGGQGVTQL